MVWRLFATKLETAETMEGVALNMRIVFLPDLDSEGRLHTDNINILDRCGRGFKRYP